MGEDGFKRRALARPDAIAPLRHAVAEYAQSFDAPARVLDGLRLAVSEALTNVVVHAYLGREPGEMMVEALRDAMHVIVRVTDNGHGLIPRGDCPGLGLGFGLMASMADEFRIANREAGPGTSVSLRCSLAEEAGTSAG